MLRIVVAALVWSCDSKTPPGKWSLEWADEFNGKVLNASWWHIGTLAAQNGDLIPGSCIGKGKCAHLLNTQYAGYITEEDVLLSDGILSLRNQKRQINGTDPAATFEYTSGLIHTLHNVFYTYGYIEARMRMPLGSKIWPAFWTVEEDLQWGSEFDIGEYFGTAAWVPGKNLHAGLHTGIGGKNWYEKWVNVCDNNQQKSQCQAASTWNTYGLRWGPDGFEFYVNDVVVNSGLSSWSNMTNYPTKEMYMILNNGVQNNDVSADDTPWPNTVDFDYVRLYKEVGQDGQLVGGPVRVNVEDTRLFV